MTRLRVIWTRPDGGVSVLTPQRECIEDLFFGGAIDLRYHGRRGLRRFIWSVYRNDLARVLADVQNDRIPLDVARAWDIWKWVKDPRWRPDRADRVELATRWVDALIRGGLDETAAVRLIAEKDVEPGAHHVEIVDVDEIPTDRTHRNSWRRSDNGGPICYA
jgi:hypothetical protein